MALIFLLNRVILLTACYFSTGLLNAQTIDEARYYFKQGNLKKAFLLTKELVQQSVKPAAKADVLSLQGNILRHLNKTKAATDVHMEVLQMRKKIYGKNSAEVANSLINLANCYSDLGYYKTAILYFTKAKKIQEQQLATCDSTKILADNGLSNAFLQARIFDKGEQQAKDALHMQELCFGKENPILINALLNFANIYFERRDSFSLDRALVLLNRASRLQQLQGVQNHMMAVIYQHIGNVVQQKGNLDEAKIYYKKSLYINSNLPSVSLTELASNYFSIGSNLTDRGDFTTALLHLRKALSLLESSRHSLKAQVLNELAICQQYLGDWERAIQTYSEAITVLKNQPYGNDYLLAGFYLNMGNCYLDLKKTAAAFTYYEKALKIWQNFPNSSSSKEIMKAFWQVGDIYLIQNQPKIALGYYQKALNQSSAESSQNYKALGYLHIAKAKHLLGDYKESLQYYDQALILLNFKLGKEYLSYPLETLSALSGRLAVIFDMADRADLKEKWQQLANNYEVAIKVFEKVLTPLEENESTVSLRDSYHDLYAGITETYFRLGAYNALFYEKALFYAESGKAFMLKKLLHQQANELPTIFLQEDKRLQGKLMALKKQRALYEMQDQIWAESRIAALDSAILVETTAYQVWSKKAKEGSTNNSSLPTNIKISVIQNSLQSHEVLLHYCYGRKKVLLFAIGKNNFQTYEIPISEKLEQTVERFYKKLSNPPYLDATNRDFAEEGYFLYKELLAPVKLPANVTLIIIPDGILNYVPFEALLVEKPSRAESYEKYLYLIQKHAVSYSLSFLLPSINQKPAIKSLLAVAPKFEAHPTGLLPLVYNGIESKQVSQLWSGSKLLQGKEATKANLLALAGQYRILHLSTHGVVNNQYPLYSYLAFSAVPDNVENELLYVTELAALSLSADLVVLSACQTAKGPFYRGEGMMSMTRAVLATGSKSVIASLWSVDDQKTSVLMELFYKYLKKGYRKNQALQLAKSDFIEQSNRLTAHPYHWAGFVLNGDTTAIQSKTYWLPVVIGIVLSFMFFIFIRNYNFFKRYIQQKSLSLDHQDQ